MAVKVYKLDDLFDRYRDSRSGPRTPARLILTVFLAGLWLRAGSLHEMERMVVNGDLAGILGPQAKVREDTLRRFLEDGDLPSLRAYLGSIVRRSRYNKVFPHGTLGGFVVAALDGNELFYTLRRLSLAGPERIWQLMHRRWDIENSLFNDLTQNWGLTHCSTRHPHAIETLCLLLAIARNLFLLFFFRRLGETTRRGQTWIGVCRSLWSGFSSPRLLERLGRPFWRRPSVPARPSLAPG